MVCPEKMTCHVNAQQCNGHDPCHSLPFVQVIGGYQKHHSQDSLNQLAAVDHIADNLLKGRIGDKTEYQQH